MTSHRRTQHGHASRRDRLSIFIEDAADNGAGACEWNIDVHLLTARERDRCCPAERTRLTVGSGDIPGARDGHLPGSRLEILQHETTPIVGNGFAWCF